MEGDDAAKLPPITVEPDSTAFDLPETHKVCPDCARGVEAPGIVYPRDSLRPIEEFYEQRAKRFKGEVRRSAYCKPHQRKRNNAYREGKPDPTVAERVARSVKKSGYEEDPKRVQKKWDNFRAWYRRNRGYDLERNAEWAKKHQERRRQSKLASLARRKRGESATLKGRKVK
jgi:hypothetical protein